MIDDNTWETAAFDEDWLWFPRQRHYIFDIPRLSGRKLMTVDLYVSATADPSKSSITKAPGNLALLKNPRKNGIDVKNDTCSDGYLRVLVEAYPLPPNAESDGKAGEGRDAGPSDAADGVDGADAWE